MKLTHTMETQRLQHLNKQRNNIIRRTKVLLW